MSVGRYLLRSDSRVSTASVICLFVPLYFRQLSQELSVKIKMVLGKFMVISVNRYWPTLISTNEIRGTTEIKNITHFIKLTSK